MEVQQQLGEWYPLLNPLFSQPWMQKLGRAIFAVRDTVQPQLDYLFRAFALCPPSKMKVVILGQDPYINGEADGLAFSSYGKMTPSLEVVFEEINRTFWTRRTQTHLDDWASQGVLLLNSVLTTRMGKSKAHEGWGWENFVTEVLNMVNDLPQSLVYMLWGKDAQSTISYLRHNTRTTEARNGRGTRLVLKAHHPQAQNWNPANKFTGCNHFTDCNVFLIQHGLSPIWWGNPLHGEKRHEWWTGYLQHLKMISHAEVNITPLLYSYPAVPDKPHPFSDGLEPLHQDNLPF